MLYTPSLTAATIKRHQFVLGQPRRCARPLLWKSMANVEICCQDVVTAMTNHATTIGSRRRCQREFTSADVLVPPSPAQGAPVLAGRGRSGERTGSVAGERDLFFAFVKRSRVARVLAAWM
jgi:hypothetical protein